MSAEPYTEAYLHENVVIDFISDCWWWRPGVDDDAAIYMFAIYRGRVPSRLVALCGNDACVNPNHHGEVAA